MRRLLLIQIVHASRKSINPRSTERVIALWMHSPHYEVSMFNYVLMELQNRWILLQKTTSSVVIWSATPSPMQLLLENGGSNLMNIVLNVFGKRFIYLSKPNSLLRYVMSIILLDLWDVVQRYYFKKLSFTGA